MLIGVLMLVATGICWSFTGVILSWTAKYKISPVLALGMQLALVTGITIYMLPNYALLGEALPDRFWPLVLAMLGAGGFNAIGLLVLQRAMRVGHNGVAWAVAQSALVVPFVVGLVIFGEPCTPLRLAGVAAILLSLAMFSKTKADTSDGGQKPHGKGYLAYALVALGIFGIGQTLAVTPSHWDGLVDPANIRIPVSCFANAGIYAFLWIRKPGVFHWQVMPLAVVGSVITIGGSLLFYRGLDDLGRADMASVGFPITVGTCMVAFGLYSVLFMREPVTKWHIGGMALALAGVLAVSL